MAKLTFPSYDDPTLGPVKIEKFPSYKESNGALAQSQSLVDTFMRGAQGLATGGIQGALLQGASSLAKNTFGPQVQGVTDSLMGRGQGVLGAAGQSGQDALQAETGLTQMGVPKPLATVGGVGLAAGKLGGLAAGGAAGAVGDVAFGALNAVTPQWLKDFTAGAAKKVAENPVAQKAIQTVSNLYNSIPEGIRPNVDALINTVGLAGGGGAATVAPKAATAAGKAVKGVYDALPTLELPSLNVPEPITALQKAAASRKIPGVKGMDTQALTSAARLSEGRISTAGMGAAQRAKPLEVYDAFSKQEAKHISDLKEDPAIGIVGERIGKAYERVIERRREAGQRMSEELKKTSTNPTELRQSIGDFQRELLENGALYDTVENQIMAGSASKFASQDLTILEKYASELQRLGRNPSMAELDAFVSRIPKEIDGLKAERGITFATNAERLIRQNLDSMRTVLEKTGTKQYRESRKEYSDLSNFLDEGAGFLGKKTQSGDFARDASIAKSAVQSVLNSGKKDWLMRLEELTDYPALDEAVLALQAMKDLGDFKGASMLELLTEGGMNIPSSTRGWAGRMLGMAGNKAGDIFVGPMTERTRTFLKSLDND